MGSEYYSEREQDEWFETLLEKHGKVLMQLKRENPEEFYQASNQYDSWMRDNNHICADRMLWEFLGEQLVFLGIKVDPFLSAFALYPLAASVAVAVGQSCTTPLSRITILSQVEGGRRGRTISEQAARIMEEEGYEALWKGNLVFIAHRLTFYGINLFAYLQFKTLLMPHLPTMELGRLALVSGGLAALTATAISHPLDTLTTRIAVQSSKNDEGALCTFCNICRDDGFESLYAGISAALLGIIPSMAISLTVYNRLSTSLKKLNPDSPSMIALVCGGIAGLATATATFPIEVVQRRMQTEDPKRVGRRRGIRQVLGEIIDKEGVGGLYKGIQPRCLQAVVGHAAAFVTYEMAKHSSFISLHS